MRHGSIRWYGERLNSGRIERLATLGLGLTHPVSKRSIVFTPEGFDADFDPDELSALLTSAHGEITFGLWLTHSSNVVVTVSGSAQHGLNVFSLDGLDFEEQDRVCAAVLWVASHDRGARLVVADDYLDDFVDSEPDAWDAYVAGIAGRPPIVPKLLFERDATGHFRVEYAPDSWHL